MRRCLRRRTRKRGSGSRSWRRRSVRDACDASCALFARRHACLRLPTRLRMIQRRVCCMRLCLCVDASLSTRWLCAKQVVALEHLVAEQRQQLSKKDLRIAELCDRSRTGTVPYSVQAADPMFACWCERGWLPYRKLLCCSLVSWSWRRKVCVCVRVRTRACASAYVRACACA